MSMVEEMITQPKKIKMMQELAEETKEIRKDAVALKKRSKGLLKGLMF